MISLNLKYAISAAVGIIILGILWFASGLSSYFAVQESMELETYHLESGQQFELTAKKLTKLIGGQSIEMLGYNGQIPGPLLKVNQGDEINIVFRNEIGEDTTVHWHGVRLDNAFDGVPEVTQDPVGHGETFVYKVKFPDEGIYWYHPHIREDKQQELGLYGAILVDPAEQDYYNPVNTEEVLIIDDIKLGFKFHDDFVDHAIMGRFGDVMLVNGKTQYEFSVKRGEVVRLFILNAANARVFNLSIPGVAMKLTGSDGGGYEKEKFVDSLIISPSERYVVEAFFEKEGVFEIKSITPVSEYILGKIIVSAEKGSFDYSPDFLALGENPYVKAEMQEMKEYFDKNPDAEFVLTVKLGHSMAMTESEDYDIEWEDTMGMMNVHMTDKLTEWIIRDKETGKENMDIDYAWKVGDSIKIRFVNDPESDHPMQHPMHLHGQRFLVLAVNDLPSDNLVWKDTVLVPKNATVDILVDVTNPGLWMAHCHIAEHLHSGMMMVFNVTD